MDGVAVLVQLAVANAGVLALVDEDNIAAGVLPQGITLPAVSITLVSGVPRNILAPGATRHVTDRVQATVMAKDYPTQKAVQEAVEKAAADTMPAVDGITNVVVHLDAQGPDFMNEEASIYLGTRDFRVSYTETR